jgi:hypothetical protein
MSSKDKVSKSVWNLMEFTKETTKKNIVHSAGQLKLDENSLKLLFNVLDASVSEGFNKGVDSSIKEITATLTSQEDAKKKK